MRLVICLLILLTAVPVMAQDLLTVNDSLVSAFYDLWKASGFGQNPMRIERAAWIYQDENGQYGWLRWPASEQPNKELWKGPIPQMAIAQAHTHTVVVDPRPSRLDRDVCKRLSIPLYTISGKGVWVVTPEGNIVQVLNSKWWNKFN